MITFLWNNWQCGRDFDSELESSKSRNEPMVSQTSLSWPLLLARPLLVTMRDLTVRAADHPDTATAFLLFFFFFCRTGLAAVETDRVCQTLQTGTSRSCVILPQYPHKEGLHSKPICYCEVEGIVTHCFSTKPRVFRQQGHKPAWDIILPPWANMQTRRATAPHGTVHTAREGTKEGAWLVCLTAIW